jgi:hypothetical protein
LISTFKSQNFIICIAQLQIAREKKENSTCNLGNCTSRTQKEKKKTLSRKTKKHNDDQQERRNGVFTNDFCGQIGDGGADGDVGGEWRLYWPSAHSIISPATPLRTAAMTSNMW